VDAKEEMIAVISVPFFTGDCPAVDVRAFVKQGLGRYNLRLW
jgi:hypothetical protein